MMNKLSQLAEMKRVTSIMEKDAGETGTGCFVVTSPFRGEGKSLVASGLALHGAINLSKKVLLLDFNWRAPTLHALFNKKQNYTFQDIKSTDDPLCFVQQTEYPDLHLLTAPKSEGCDKQKDSLELCRYVQVKAEKKYDRVIVDTCSLFPANRFMLDPIRLAKDATGTMLVFMAGQTSRGMAKKAVMMFKEYELRLAGILMNDFKNPLSGKA